MVNGSLYVFGGEDSSRRPVSELHVLDLATMAWQQVQTTGRAPAARSAHAAVVYKVGSASLYPSNYCTVHADGVLSVACTHQQAK